MKVLIVGGSRGIGKASAIKWLENGDDVSIISRTDPKIESIKWFSIDLSEVDDPRSFFPEDFWSFDVVINSVGINLKAEFLEYKLSDLQRMIAVNLIIPFRVMQLSLPFMMRQSFGRVVNVCSIWSHRGMPSRSAYNLTKFGLRGLTYSVASEIDGEDILINSISPGFVDTELTRNTLTETERVNLISSAPLKRMAHPDEVAIFINWLCSQQNTFCHGQDFIIDGGFLRC